MKSEFDMMLETACNKPTLAQALALVALWESERVVKQARTNERWDTCFEYIFAVVIKKWQKKRKAKIARKFLYELQHLRPCFSRTY